MEVVDECKWDQYKKTNLECFLRVVFVCNLFSLEYAYPFCLRLLDIPTAAKQDLRDSKYDLE